MRAAARYGLANNSSMTVCQNADSFNLVGGAHLASRRHVQYAY